MLPFLALQSTLWIDPRVSFQEAICQALEEGGIRASLVSTLEAAEEKQRHAHFLRSGEAGFQLSARLHRQVLLL